MRRITIFTLDTPYREHLAIEGFEFGDENAEKTVAIVGSMRGNEFEQTFVCAELVRRLAEMEERCLTDRTKGVLVIPSVNPFSMNVAKRFWPVDNTDINRMFPGYDEGETTQRIAAGVFSAVSPYAYGIQMCSYYLSGDFSPHVRVTHVNDRSVESLAMADDFGLPYVVEHQPSSFDTTTLSYNWQVWETRAFSVYSRDMGGLDVGIASMVEDCIMRFLAARGVLTTADSGGMRSVHFDEANLVRVRTTKAGGFLLRTVNVGDRVQRDQELGRVIDAMDGHVRERLLSPVDGRVFFEHMDPLVNQYTICFALVASHGWEHAE
jgi:predicted deacylase